MFHQLLRYLVKHEIHLLYFLRNNYILTFTFLSIYMQGTLDVGLIDSVCASDNPDR